jgi:formylglycine-generating enzyme required for sulfatase activity/tRNA A-37 threonylcarbamoyl transferase component Bud32
MNPHDRGEMSTVEQARLVDRICTEFEDAWRSGRPRIEDFLASGAAAGEGALLWELIALDVEYRRRAGEQPGADDYLARFPALEASRLAEVVRPRRSRPSALREARVGADVNPALAALLEEQQACWRRGEHVPVEALLASQAALREDGEAVLELILHEVLLRRERGETPELADYQRRFPHLAGPLAIQFEVERAIESPSVPLTWVSSPTVRGADGAPGADPPRAAPPRLPGYEILGELGRGGMGVVYKARQVRLNRVVALKMVLSGGHATSEERLRFLAEAEAIAAVRHPGIVQVHDFGTHDGLPYFSLELCEGGSLAGKLAGGPLPPGETARLVEQVARAVQAAHERGIVHRDLKPGNVLLDGNGQPRVTDFGLAKRTEISDGLTRTGTVVGTPSYLAPEQAQGKKEVGPAADVYALGAILYECLTGRPPYKAASVYDTLMQVVNDEVVSPRQLNQAVPADLETICLKCLHKEPTRRYASAQALAGDLARWQAGEPIAARQAGLRERAVKWARRRPAAAALVGVSLLAALVLVGLSAVAVLQWQRAVTALTSEKQARKDLESEQEMRALAQVGALRDAAPGAVPGLLAELKATRQDVLPPLRQLWQQERDPGRRLRVGLALLPVEPEAVRDELVALMLKADDPAEVLLVRDALPRAPDLVERLWQRSGAKQAGVRFRALVALAALDPRSPRWARAGPGVVEELLSANPLYLGAWVAALRPVRGALLAPLAEVLRGRRLGDYRQVAATVLADYAADRPDVLAELLLDADAKQHALLRRGLDAYREQAAARMHRELAGVPDYWKDPPLAAAWKAVPDRVAAELEAAQGLLAERWALCQALPLGRLAAVADALRPAGYRPVRVRPWAAGEGVRVAVVWARDGRDWTLDVALSADEVRAGADRQGKAGFIPADVAGYRAAEGERYVALWARAGKAAAGDPPAALLVGASATGLASACDARRKASYVPWTIQRLRGGEGGEHFAVVWWKGAGRPEEWPTPGPTIADDLDAWARAGRAEEWSLHGNDDQATHAGRASDGEMLLVDVDLAFSGGQDSPRGKQPGDAGQPRYASVWHDDVSREAVGLHGLRADVHLSRCRELARQGYRPAALSLAGTPTTPPLAASAWHRPVLAPEEAQRLARRQANAAATLLLLGQPEGAWPLLRHRPDPTVRSYLVQRAAALGVDPRLLAGRLDEEKDASARRALIVALGECTEQQLPDEVRRPLTARMLRWYRDDPDAGAHGAIDWLLRHGREGPHLRPLGWGQAAALDRIDDVLRRRDPDDRAGWYVNLQGQTMTLVRGPVTFRMGSPPTEESRRAGERPHLRRIGRSYAIATKPVTVAQFEAFRKDRPGLEHHYPKRYSSAPTGPVLAVTFYEAAQYCNWLSEKEGIPREQWCYPEEVKEGSRPLPGYLSRTGYRLPTEAEHEYACRAGAVTSRYYGTGLELLPRYAWYVGNARDQGWPVGQKRPNDLGLFDMYGNVWTWCQDAYFPYPAASPRAIEDGEDTRDFDDRTSRVMRGGSFDFSAPFLRSAYRATFRPSNRFLALGLRVARTCTPFLKKEGMGNER